MSRLAPLALTLALLLSIGHRASAAAAAEATDYFEQHVRPLLSESCYECHGEQKQKGGLRLDSKGGWEKGGDSGPAVVPGQPEKSLLIQAVRYHEKDLAMPPEKSGGKMPDEKIALLENWVKIGAPDPRTGGPVSTAKNIEGARQHWSFKPVVSPELPKVKNESWIKTPVDAFVLAKLEAKGLAPAPPADKRTLLRRLYLDLTGLPPSAAATEAFLNDSGTGAVARVVDQLLDSPQYGERYGRYWLDIARYADTKGYLAGGEERRFPFSFTYRDYVIRAFNEDKPYDRFLCEQIAADRLVTKDDRSALAALGFLTLGRNGTAQEVIDDRIDVVTRGLMGLTVSCARCHDHKFDPVPTADYYSLFGVFASSEEPAEKPLLSAKVTPSPQYDDFLKQHAALEEKLTQRQNEIVESYLSMHRQKIGDYLLAVQDAKLAGPSIRLNVLAGERKLSDPILDRWIEAVKNPGLQKNPVYAAWFAFVALDAKSFAPQAKQLAAKIAANQPPGKWSPLVVEAFAEAAPTSLKDVAAIYNEIATDVERATNPEAAKALPPKANKNRKLAGQMEAEAEKAAQKAQEEKDTQSAVPATPEEKAFHASLLAEKAPNALTRSEVEKTIKKDYATRTVELRRQLTELEWSHPGAPMRAMAMVDRPRPATARILTRGNATSPGAVVPRQFLEILAGPNRQPFTDGSGRLELAHAIAARENPLTARVFVNRLWSWHFGRPFVSTPGDFGVRTEAPEQQALLDWLSAYFMDQGWSIKKLQRVILLSSTYQQASDAPAKGDQVDPENLLIHHYNRHRLDFEAMRDTLLASAGKLDTTVGGLPVDLWQQPYSTRRTVYGYIDRLNLPAVFRTFDFANPDISSPMRFTTTVPQQALFMMNSPFVIQQSQALLKRPEVQGAPDDVARLTALYQLLFQRPPEPVEVKDAQAYLARYKSAPAIQGGWHYGYGWYDPLVNHLKDFHEFKTASATRRSPEQKVPSTQFGFCQLTPAGGHPGSMLQTSSVLRWVSPAEGKVNITGTIKHNSKDGDGVRALIVSGRGGKLGAWTVQASSAVTELKEVSVKLGEAIDFVVECQKNDRSDGFYWSPRITFITDLDPPQEKKSWDASADFAPARKLAPLTAWETLSQAMLVSNELMFIE